MPAPIKLTRAIWLLDVTPRPPISTISSSKLGTHFSKSPRGTVKEMSVTPSADTFCTIMSTSISMSAMRRNTAAATPGLSGTACKVTFASEVSCVTAEIIGFSTDFASCPPAAFAAVSAWVSFTSVPGSHVKAERTCNVIV